MRALSIAFGVAGWLVGSAIAPAQQISAVNDQQVASCPTVLPVVEGERSIVVPTAAMELPLHIASRPGGEALDAQRSILQQKLAERDRLQREIAELRAATQTPEQILVRVKVLEVNRTKLRQAGVKISVIGSDPSKPIDLVPYLCGESAAASANDPALPGARVPAASCNHVTFDNSALAGVFELLEEQQFARTVAAPEIVTLDARPASFRVGSQFPVPPAEKGGTVTTKDYGTQLDVTATMLGDNRVRLQIHPRVSELDESRGIVVGGQSVPAITLREVDFGCEVEVGKSFLVSGLIKERRITKSSYMGLRKSEAVEQIALVVVATPEIVR